MNINKIDDFLYQKTKKALDLFFEYMKPAFDIIKEQGITMFSENERELLTIYNKDDILYQINSTILIMELFLVIELYIKTELFKSNECFLYRCIDKYPEEKKKENELLDKKNKDFEQIKLKMVEAMKKKNNERYNTLVKEFVASIFDIKKPNEFYSVNVKEALIRLIDYLNWNIPEEFFPKFNTLIYCRNEIIHFGNFSNLTIGTSSAMNVIHSLATGAKEESQQGFYKKFSKIPDEFAEEIKYYNELFQHIYFNEHYEKIINNSLSVYMEK